MKGNRGGGPSSELKMCKRSKRLGVAGRGVVGAMIFLLTPAPAAPLEGNIQC